MRKIIPLETKRIRLMPYTTNDDSYVVDLHGKESNSVFDDFDKPKSGEEFKNRIKDYANTHSIGWICWIKVPVLRIGVVSFSNIIPGISALFHPILDVENYKVLLRRNGKVSHKGLIEEASESAISYIMKEFQLQRITGGFFKHNKLAVNLCKRLGFKEEGIIRNGTRLNNQPVDMVILGILREEIKDV